MDIRVLVAETDLSKVIQVHQYLSKPSFDAMQDNASPIPISSQKKKVFHLVYIPKGNPFKICYSGNKNDGYNH